MGKLGRIRDAFDQIQGTLLAQIEAEEVHQNIRAQMNGLYMFCEAGVKEDQLQRFKDRSKANKEKAEADKIHKKIICIDFDGVIHSYTSGWQGATTIADQPVMGAITWLASMVDNPEFDPQIYSARSAQGGIPVMKEWLLQWGLPGEYLAKIKFPKEKPPAFLTIDDRCIKFDGKFPSVKALREFKTWQSQEV